MDVLFVVKEIYHEHLGIMLLSQILKNAGHSVEVEAAVYMRLRRQLKKKTFDIIAFSTPSLFYDEFLLLNKQLKKDFDYYAVFGGAHPTFAPEIIEETSIDCVCRGEGEGAFLELVEALEAKAPVCDIENLWVKEKGTVYKNRLRPLLNDLDSLPFADRGLFPCSEPFTKGKMHVLTGRGCPFDCSYCSHPALCKLYGNQARMIRRRSVDNVIAEIQSLQTQTRLRFIMFEDDLFTLDNIWLHDFATQYRRHIRLPFFCYGRATSISEDNTCLLREAGCVTLSIGIETANDYLRNTVLRRDMKIKCIVNAAALIKKAGIRLEGLNIIGIPQGNLSDDLDTLRLNSMCRVDYASVKLLMPYPGTEIREVAQATGLLVPGFDRWRSSIFFQHRREKRAVENLLALFGIAVEFPFLLPIIRVVIYWPLGFFYKVCFYLWDGYAAFFRLYPTGRQGFFWGIRKYLILVKNEIIGSRKI
jgi:anaerobic magnesium-protoporphyrin IX monomethyl ester cyclase